MMPHRRMAALAFLVLVVLASISALLSDPATSTSVGSALAHTLGFGPEHRASLALALEKHLVPRLLGVVWAVALTWAYLVVAPFKDETSVERTWFTLAVVGALALGALTGTRRDYFGYVEEWDWVLKGNNPWTLPSEYFPFPKNPYAPLFNAFAILERICVYIPKLVFILAQAHVYRVLTRGRSRGGAVAILLLCPFCFFEVVINGHIDGFIAALGLAAIFARPESSLFARRTLALAFGTLIKLYPALLAPNLLTGAAWREGRRFKPSLAFAAWLIATFALSCLLWGDETFTPFRTNAVRDVGGTALNLPFATVVGRAIGPAGAKLALKAVFFGGTIATMIACFVRRLEPIATSILVLLFALNFNTVTNSQYMIVILVFLAALFARTVVSGRIAAAATLFALVLNAAEIASEIEAELKVPIEERFPRINMVFSCLVGAASVFLFVVMMLDGQRETASADAIIASRS